MKRWIPWLVAAVVVVLLGGGVWRAMAARQVQQKALAEANAQRAQAPLQLAADEVLQVRRQNLAVGVPVSGALRAVDSAMVKARAGGELQGLTLREGDSVKAGQEVARIDPTEARARLRQAQQQAEAAKSQVDINQRQYANNRALVDQGFISATALVTSQASLEAAQSSYQAAVAAADVARKALEDTVLRSPISGMVAQRLAQPGERVALEARLLEIIDLDRLELEATVPAAELARTRIGAGAVLQVEGVDTPVRARVLRISPAAQAGTRSVPVHLAIEPAPGLRAGLFARGRIEQGRRSTLVLPLSAVRVDQPQPHVIELDTGAGLLRQRAVRTGARGEIDGTASIEILDGLTEGARVLAGRLGPVRDGTPAVLR